MGSEHVAWLKKELSTVLGWDEFVIEGVVQAISNSNSRAEIQEIVENFMEGNKAATKVINQYMAKKDQPKSLLSTVSARATGPVRPAAASAPSAANSMPGPAQTAPQQEAPAGFTRYNKWDNHDRNYVTGTTSGKGKGKGKSAAPDEPHTTASESAASATTQAKSHTSQSAPADASATNGGNKPAGSGGDNTRYGGKGKKGGGGRRDDQLLAAAAKLERKVVNCLSCGKIYDCRSVTNEVIRFLESGGTCTFCGNRVSLSYSSGSHPSQPRGSNANPQRIQDVGTNLHPAAAAEEGAAHSAADAATAVAVAFKDRLVEFDRNAAQRTTVIDDQSDFFEIDSNSWLTEQERSQLRLQQQVEADAEASRRRRVKVTLDLLGRQVLLADDDFRAQERAAADALTENKSASVTAATVSAAQPGTMSIQDELRMVSRAQSEALKAQSAAALRQLKITANPSLSVPAPVFLSSDKAAATDAPVANRNSQQGSAATHSNSKEKCGASSQTSTLQSTRAANRQARSEQRKSNRLQDDSIFDYFEADLILDAAVMQNDAIHTSSQSASTPGAVETEQATG